MSNTALTFPCLFPIKVVGNSSAEFERDVLTAISKHFSSLTENAIRHRHSKDKKYLSMTITVTAENQAQLDAAYHEISALPSVLITL